MTIIALTRFDVILSVDFDHCGICGRHLYVRHGENNNAALRVDDITRASHCHIRCAKSAAHEAAERGHIAVITYACGKPERVVRPEDLRGKQPRRNRKTGGP